MTAKILVGTYASGYTLTASYSSVSVTGNGLIESAAGAYPDAAANVALVMPKGGSLMNDGSVRGGAGGSATTVGQADNEGGAGGGGVSLAGIGDVDNGGVIAGGAGGIGGQGVQFNVNEYPGGAGGAGLALASGGDVTNTGSILGGLGGAGGYYEGSGGAAAPQSVGSVGGSGGDGVDIEHGSLTNSGIIAGGAGGAAGLGYHGQGGFGGAGIDLEGGGRITNQGGRIAGGSGGASAYLAYAGVGGAGITLAAGGIVVNDGGLIVGGAGAAAGSEAFSVTYATSGSAGAAGGAGIATSEPANIYNAGSIRGGAGGAGGVGDGLGARAGAGGAGGAGVDLLAGSDLRNVGTIIGGAGGAAGRAFNGAARATAGPQGYGVVLGPDAFMVNGTDNGSKGAVLIEGGVGVEMARGAVLDNYGTVVGSSSVSVLLQSSTDTLVAEAGSDFVGVVSGGGGELELPGAGITITGLGEAGAVSGSRTLTFGGFGYYVVYGGDWKGANTVRSGASLGVDGVVDNTGVIAVGGAGGRANLVVHYAATLTGAGSVVLESDGINRIVGESYYEQTLPDRLTNDSTISGTGFIGFDELALVNGPTGVIDGDAAGALVVSTAGQTLVNTGLMESSGSGELRIASTTVDDSGGGTIGSTGGQVELQDADVIGGTLSTSGAGQVTVNLGSSILDGTGSHPVSLTGRLVLDDKTSLTLEGSLINSGIIQLKADPDATSLVIGAGDATLSGGGMIELSLTAANAITATTAKSTLANLDNRITGVGTIGSANLTLVNEAKGFIGSDRSTALTIDTGTNTIVNAGEIEGYDGGVVIESPVDNTRELIAYKGDLTVDSAVTGDGLVHVSSGTADFTGAFSENAVFGATGELELAKSQSYAGGITGFSKSTSLDLGDIAFGAKTTTSYSGTGVSGVLTVTDGTHVAKITLEGDYLGSTFAAASDGHGGTIVTDPAKTAARTSGSTIPPPTGGGSETVTTTLTFNDTAPGTRLFLNPNFWTPEGAPDARDSAILPAAENTAEPYTALVSANETVASFGVGVGAILAIAPDVTLDATYGGSLANAGEVELLDGQGYDGGLTFGGTLKNTGVIDSGTSGGQILSDNGTLTGGGVVEGNGGLVIEGLLQAYQPAASFTNVDNTISNARIFGIFVNGAKGVVIDGGLEGIDTNTGLLVGMASGGGGAPDSGGLAIEASVDNPGGVILAGDHSYVELNGADIMGGTLRAVGSGTFEIGDLRANADYSELDGSVSPVSVQGAIDIPDDAIVIVDGTIDDASAISLASTGEVSQLLVEVGNDVAGDATFTGAGVVALSASPNNSIVGTLTHKIGMPVAISQLANGVTIVGAGDIGYDLSLSNTGLIDAIGLGTSVSNNSRSLVIATGSSKVAGSNTIANSGTLEATNPTDLATTGGLVLRDVVIDNAYAQGVIEAVGPNTHVDLQSAIINGGDLKTSAGGVIDTVDTDSVLDGFGHTVYVKGALVIDDGTALEIESGISEQGSITLAASSHATDLIIGVDTVLYGEGAITLGDNADNAIVEGAPGIKGKPASLTNVQNTISGAGTISAYLINEAAGIVDASGTHTLVIDTGATAIVNDGTFEVTGPGGLIIDSAVTGSGLAKIAEGTLNAEASFSQDVAFTGISGKLVLHDSPGYAATVSGFSTSGRTSFDLRDIGFVSAGEATFKGTTSGGVLTVTDGTHTASIHLSGDYLGSTFTAASDGHGGTIVTDPAKTKATENAVTAPLQRLLAMAAGLGSSAGGEAAVGYEPWRSAQPMLAAHGANP